MKIFDNVHLYNPAQGFHRDKIHHCVIKDGVFQAIETGRYGGTETDVINGNGNVLCPSFIDSHLHLLRYGLMKNGLDLRKATSWDEVKQLISDKQTKKELQESQWIVARGLTDNMYDDLQGLVTAMHLDEIEDRRPMFILHKDGHECVVNTPALTKIKKDQNLQTAHAAFIETDADGNLTGRFKDTAVHYIKFNFRSKTPDEIAEALETAFPFLSRNGITSVHTDDLNYAGTYQKVWDGYRALEEKHALPLRAFLHHYVFDIEDMKRFLNNNSKRTGDGTDKVRVGAFKIFVDGTHRLHTAALRKPYHDEPGEQGTLIYEQDDLDAMLSLAEENNMQVAMHCIGDRAVEGALHAIKKAGNTMRHRIIHAQTLGADLLGHIEERKPCIETQPGFLLDEWNQYAGWVGEKRGPYCGMGQSLIDTGAPFTLSSDAPIGPINPFKHIFAAVNRTSIGGHPAGGWIPNEKMTLSAAFKRYTSTPAYLEFMEETKGVIKPGAKADFMVLADFPDAYPATDLHNIDVHQTWVAGEKVYDQAY